MKVFIWCPLISEVGTTNTIINIKAAINKFSKSKIENFVINVAEEYRIQKILESFNTKLINLKTKLNFNKLPKNSLLKSKIYLFNNIFFHFQITQITKRKKTGFFDGAYFNTHSLFYFTFFKYNTKFILENIGIHT